MMRCPGCEGDLSSSGSGLACKSCGHEFPIDSGVPILFWPNDWEEGAPDVTEQVKSFYEETPFPNYNEFDSVDSLTRKAREGIFARLLDEQVPPGALIIDCGSGTSQLSNFLSIAKRDVFATDLCVNSLRLGQRFAKDHGLERVRFVNINLFRPPFKPGSFDLVIANGVLHHTSDPFRAFQSIAWLARPGGYVLVGLYHRYGRLITDTRRLLFRLSGDRFRWLDPNLRNVDQSEAKKQAWFADQYKHPHESKHTIGEVLGWLEKTGLRFVKSIPRARPFDPISPAEQLFRPERPGTAMERFAVETGMTLRGSREGGFFIVIAQRPERG
jgi:SAM-dependent methyltransferase